MHRKQAAVLAALAVGGSCDAHCPTTPALAPAPMSAAAHGPTPAALQAYQAARLPANAFVHRQSLQMHADFQSGRYKPGGSPPLELTRSVELGLWGKRFEPLAAAAAARQ